MKPPPVMPKHCATCPFHAAGWTELRGLLSERALRAAPLCHSSGRKALQPGGPARAHVCRGARDLQLQIMYRLGFLAAPTDEAWQAAVVANCHGKQ